MTNQTWFVDLDLKLDEPVSDALLDDLVEVVEPFHGAISAGDEPKLGLSLAFEAIDAWAATASARTFLEMDLCRIVSKVEISSCRVLDEATRNAENEEPTFPALVAVPDIAEMLGVSRQQAHRLSSREGFPAPALEPRTGPLWLLAAVEAWSQHTERKAGRPTKSAATKEAATDAALEALGEFKGQVEIAVKEAMGRSREAVKTRTSGQKVVKNPGSSSKVVKDPGSSSYTRTIRG
ncbi:helix-turn-helix transcriptional regulator [Paenarthrobacter sp. NyZ202]|uniref:helix-turn-helix transcriptional regulator n=1 Tax=Paenarthrobacter sp. NyZ202 TaxID=3402689 RepID=UPI003CFB404D